MLESCYFHWGGSLALVGEQYSTIGELAGSASSSRGVMAAVGQTVRFQRLPGHGNRAPVQPDALALREQTFRYKAFLQRHVLAWTAGL